MMRAVMRAVIVLVVLVGAYASPTGPDVTLTFTADAPAEFRHYVTAGAGEWRELGFVVVDVARSPACAPTWLADGERDCTLAVDIERQELPDGIAGLTAGEDITFSVLLGTDTYARKLELWAVAAHEFGHALLHLPHLPPGQGVMSSPPAGDDGHTLTDADVELACAAGACGGDS